MIMKKITGDKSVFPIKHLMEDGITIRQYYAGLAMQGFICTYGSDSQPSSEESAKFAVEMADRLIAELNKSEPE